MLDRRWDKVAERGFPKCQAVLNLALFAVVHLRKLFSQVYIFVRYVLDKEKTDDTLISSKDCMAETAQKEFELTKHRFGKTDGRTYFHIVQSF